MGTKQEDAGIFVCTGDGGALDQLTDPRKERMRPPQADIDEALRIEAEVPEATRALYLECLNGLPMSRRVSDQELRDGCILTHNVYLACVRRDTTSSFKP